MKFNKVNAWLMAVSLTATTVAVNGLPMYVEAIQPSVESTANEETVIIDILADELDGTEIKEEAFQNHYQFENVVLQEGITSIGRSAFFNCVSMKSIVVPSSVKVIEQGAFQNCTALERIDLSKTSVTEIAEETFRGCKNLKEVILPSGVITIQADAFQGCGALKKVNLSSLKEIKKIASGAFANCISLKEVVLPESVATIGGGAFANCIGLEEITIPGSVTEFGQAVLEGVTNVTVKSVVNSYAYDYAVRKELNFEATSDEILVSEIKVENENITYNKENTKRITLKVGERISLNVALAPVNATNKNIIWEPDKEGVVSFAEDGTITGLKRGFVSVFVRAEGGVNKADYIEINVRA